MMTELSRVFVCVSAGGGPSTLLSMDEQKVLQSLERLDDQLKGYCSLIMFFVLHSSSHTLLTLTVYQTHEIFL